MEQQSPVTGQLAELIENDLANIPVEHRGLFLPRFRDLADVVLQPVDEAVAKGAAGGICRMTTVPSNDRLKLTKRDDLFR